MGCLFALCGPSGAGKTTLLENLRGSQPQRLHFLPKATDREPRPSEIEGLEYNFYSTSTFLDKLFAGDFCHIERYQNTLFGIERFRILDVIESNDDAVVQAGIYGGVQLQFMFPNHVHLLYMYVVPSTYLLSTDCLRHNSSCTRELIWRLRLKLSRGKFLSARAPEDIVEERMKLNFLDLATFNGELRRSNKALILENLRDQQKATLDSFLRIRHKISPQGSDL